MKHIDELSIQELLSLGPVLNNVIAGSIERMVICRALGMAADGDFLSAYEVDGKKAKVIHITDCIHGGRTGVQYAHNVPVHGIDYPCSPQGLVRTPTGVTVPAPANERYLVQSKPAHATTWACFAFLEPPP